MIFSFSFTLKCVVMIVCTIVLHAAQPTVGDTYIRASKSNTLATSSQPVQCSNGKSIDGSSGVEKYLTPDMICKFFPIWTWKYPPDTGISGNDGGIKTNSCSEASQSLINDLACIAAFFAHVGKETGGLGTGKFYTGRGYHQISWNYNYWAFSNFVYSESDGHTLLLDPDRVADELELAWGSALRFWFTDRDHENGYCTTLTDQVGKTLLEGYGFSSTTSVINGGIECPPGGGTGGAEVRVQMFLYILGVMDESSLPTEIGTSDTPAPKWLTQGCPAIDTNCQLTCKSITGSLTVSVQDTYPDGWNDGWVGTVTRYACVCGSGGSGGCGPETSGGTASDKSKWPWPLLLSGGSIPTNPCSPNPCGAGSCSQSGSNYSCSCPSGYQFNGSTCNQQTANPCSPNPCGTGSCTQNGSSYSCSCPSGYEYNGSTCSQSGGESGVACGDIKACYSSCVTANV